MNAALGPILLVILATLALLAAAALGFRVGQQRQQRRLHDAVAGAEAHWQAQAKRLAALAAAEERERIYSDLHDDLGASLLQLVYRAPDEATADLARAALQDLRDVVSRSRGAPGSLLEVLGDIRREAAQRLAAVASELRWEQPDDLPEQALDPARALHLYRIVREAISNALRHAHARRLRVRIRVAGDQLALELTDDGEARLDARARPGRGMRSMQDRAERLHGDIRWTRGTEGGTKVLLTVPLAG